MRMWMCMCMCMHVHIVHVHEDACKCMRKCMRKCTSVWHVHRSNLQHIRCGMHACSNMHRQSTGNCQRLACSAERHGAATAVGLCLLGVDLLRQGTCAWGHGATVVLVHCCHVARQLSTQPRAEAGGTNYCAPHSTPQAAAGCARSGKENRCEGSRALGCDAPSPAGA